MWEYKQKEYHGSFDDALADFTEQGKDGWEVIFISQNTGLVVFKRRRNEPTKH